MANSNLKHERPWEESLLTAGDSSPWSQLWRRLFDWLMEPIPFPRADWYEGECNHARYNEEEPEWDNNATLETARLKPRPK